ncbi:MAG: LVIVD repeat-containing protein [Solirubrobacteraceae bacterium]
MTHSRVRPVCAAAIAVAAVAVSPGPAGAHPVDCVSGALATAPHADWLAGWTAEDGCTSAADSDARPAAAASEGTDNVAPAASTAKLDARKRKTGSFRQVGHDPLMSRGMNAAIALHGDYAYIGSRTDGGHEGQPHGGVMVVDVSDPSDPTLLGPPFDANPGESSRELRVWKSQDILIVLNTNCGVGPTLHHCTRPSISNMRFYDISGGNAREPQLLNQFDVDTHEFFLWEDPGNPERALIFAGNAGSSCGTRGGSPTCPFSVWDISQVPNGEPPVTLFSGLHGYTQFEQKPTGGLHSLSISNDGSRAYFALLSGGFAVVDVSEFAEGAPSPQPHPITINSARPTWPGPGAHSAVKLWDRDWAWVSDEVYGTATGGSHGCPWGWARMIEISDPQAPTVRGEYRVPENDPSTCDDWNPPRTSYSAHNPTLTPHIAFSTWHSGGFQAVGLLNPHRPFQLAEFFPEPLDEVLLEDPRLSSDPDTGRNEKVVMWSYAIVKDGLIYVVDLRNGLYVLEYKGASEREVGRIGFLEGNSNQGHALCYEPVGRAPAYCD